MKEIKSAQYKKHTNTLCIFINTCYEYDRLQENIVVMLLLLQVFLLFFIDFSSFHFHFACNFCVCQRFSISIISTSVSFFYFFFLRSLSLYFLHIQCGILIIKTSFTRLQSFTFNSSKTACSINAILCCYYENQTPAERAMEIQLGLIF